MCGLSVRHVHPDESGEFTGALWMVADLSKSKAVEAEAQEARQKLDVKSAT